MGLLPLRRAQQRLCYASVVRSDADQKSNLDPVGRRGADPFDFPVLCPVPNPIGCFCSEAFWQRQFWQKTEKVIFDNGRVDVKDGFGAHAQKQAGYTALSAHYGFNALF